MSPANTPPPPARPGAWLLATVQLADGRTLELQIPAATAAAVSSCDPPADGQPSLTVVLADGQRRRGRIRQLFGS